MGGRFTGSSPRIRGESLFVIELVRTSGIIPANTGRILPGRQRRYGTRDHPREYGENLRHLAPEVQAEGSSPRIRGESTCIGMAMPVSRDHPREYGENPYPLRPCGRSAGSSPRIRGEFPDDQEQVEDRRIIPANTGRIRQQGRHLQASGDHPREYGENPHIRLSRHPHQGSSPRIRGESFCGGDVPVEVGIIPANTGRMVELHVKDGVHRDHPREYGENTC